METQVDIRDRQNSLFYAVLVYLLIFYTQIGSRVPALGKIRVEFLVGSAILGIIILKFMSGTVRLGNNRIIKGAFFFFLAVVVSVPTAYWRSHSVEALVRLFKFFSIFLMIVATVNTRRKLEIFTYFYLGCVAFVVVEAFINGASGKNFDVVDHVMRLFGTTGLFAHPNSLGGLTAGALPFIYYLFLYEKKILRKLLWVAFGLMALCVIVWTGSRTAWVGTLALMALVWLDSRRKIVMAAAGFVCLAIVWTQMGEERQNRFLSLGKTAAVIQETEQVSSMSGRWLLIKDGFGVFLERPITGVGINCFQTARGMKYDRWQVQHNTYLQALADLGLVGFSAFIYLVWGIVRSLRQSMARIGSQGEPDFLAFLAKAVLFFVFTRLVVGLFGGDLYENYWWIAGGLSIAIGRIVQADFTEEADVGEEASKLDSKGAGASGDDDTSKVVWDGY